MYGLRVSTNAAGSHVLKNSYLSERGFKTDHSSFLNHLVAGLILY